MATSSPRQRLADLLLGRPVVQFISDHRANGASYTHIAAALADATDGEINVSDEAVRLWHVRALQASQAGAA